MAVTALAVATLVHASGASLAQGQPAVTVFGAPFPGQHSPDMAFSCRFPIVFSGFPPGGMSTARVVFSAAPPTTPRSGDTTIDVESLSLDVDGTGHATYDLRGPLMDRFAPGSAAGWNVRVTIDVEDSGRALFSSEQTYVVALDCIVPLVTTSSTTTTVASVPCPSGGCTDAPPAASLAGPSGRVDGIQGSYCWTRPGSTPPVASCADTFFVAPSVALSVRPGNELELRYATSEQPTDVTVQYWDDFDPSVASDRTPFLPRGREPRTLPVSGANPARLRADLPPGTSLLVVSSRWMQGSAAHFFRLDVQPQRNGPANAAPAVLALTG